MPQLKRSRKVSVRVSLCFTEKGEEKSVISFVQPTILFHLIPDIDSIHPSNEARSLKTPGTVYPYRREKQTLLNGFKNKRHFRRSISEKLD